MRFELGMKGRFDCFGRDPALLFVVVLGVNEGMRATRGESCECIDGCMVTLVIIILDRVKRMVDGTLEVLI